MKLKLISDGTSIGTKLIDEDTGEAVNGISQIDFQVNIADAIPITEVAVKFFNIPVDIVSKADVDLLEFVADNDWKEPVHSKSFEKEIKITSEFKNFKAITGADTKISDNTSGKQIGAVQEINWTATPSEVKAKIKKIKFREEW